MANNFYISRVGMRDSLAAWRMESIAITCMSDFNRRFARTGNQLTIFAPRQKHGIAAVIRSTQNLHENRISSLSRLSDLLGYPRDSNYSLETGEITPTDRIYLCVSLEIPCLKYNNLIILIFFFQKYLILII